MFNFQALIFLALAIAILVKCGKRLFADSAHDPVERRKLVLCRASFLTFSIPFAVILLFGWYVFERSHGGQSARAIRSWLGLGGNLWLISSVVGMALAGMGSFPLKRSGYGFQLIAIHLGSFFFVYLLRYVVSIPPTP